MAEDMDVWVDYQDTDDQGRVLTLRRFFISDQKARVGQRLLTGDYEGNRCFGTVVDIGPNEVVAIELEEVTLARSGSPLPADR
ncbi:MAG TPA: hypothetical protein VE990_16135 [Acidimicrobiales bacterium]|nr:hypothetical protein [Acidimicrobiales bacterium]